MLLTKSQTWSTLHELISSHCDWHFRWLVTLLRCWLTGDSMLRLGLGDSNFKRFVTGAALRSSGVVVCCSLDVAATVEGLRGIRWWLLLLWLCWFKFDIDVLRNEWDWKRELCGVEPVRLLLAFELFWFWLLSGDSSGDFFGSFLSRLWSSASLAARAYIKFRDYLFEIKILSKFLYILTKVTSAWVLLISINGENTAGGNGMPGNIEDIKVFWVGA